MAKIKDRQMDLEEAWRMEIQGFLRDGHLIMKIFQIAKNDLVMIYIIKSRITFVRTKVHT